MKHFASPDFWFHRALPPDARELADSKFKLLKSDPRHASLRLKKADILVGANRFAISGGGKGTNRRAGLVLDRPA